MHRGQHPSPFLIRGIRFASVGAGLFLLAAQAIASTTWDFRTGQTPGSNTGDNLGNVRTFTAVGETVTVSSWGDTGSPPPGAGANEGAKTLESAFLGRFSTGLGTCNRNEAAISFCIDGEVPGHQVDNVGQQDLVLFLFDDPYFMESIVIDPFGIWDRDVSFSVGTVSQPLDLTGLGIADLGSLGFGPKNDSFNTVGGEPLTINLLNLQGNALVFGALAPPNGFRDRFTIQSLTATLVPIPAAVWLFGSGLGLLALMRRRRLTAQMPA